MTVAWLAIVLALLLIPFTEITAQAIRDLVRSVPKSVYATLTQIPSPTMLLVVAAAVWLLDVRRRAALVYLAVALAVSGLVTEPLKQILGRARPQASILRTEETPERMARLAAQYPAVRPPAHVPGSDTWLLLCSGRPWFADSFSSFPSGHAMSVFVVAAFLCALYPRGRWLWLILALGCALARVRARRHFLDDVLFSAGAGWLLACRVFTWAWVGRLAGHLGALRPAARAFIGSPAPGPGRGARVSARGCPYSPGPTSRRSGTRPSSGERKCCR